jgi:hypothetical protein
VNQPLSYDVREHINANIDVCDRIKNSRATRYDAKMERWRKFDAKHGAARAPPAPGAPGLRPFTARLRAIGWPAGFKIFRVDTYNSKANPVQWLTLYEIVVRTTGESGDVMANYLPVMLNQSTNN